jgi:NAD(P)-dependent dehydrogenase (short-subunit alcohol dehydrogenase family)
MMAAMAGRFDGRVALVVGAGPGIGRACAMAFAEGGADVVLVARRPDPLRALADDVAARHGHQALAVPADVSVVAECRRIVDEAVGAFGRLDVVVNVATVGGGQHRVDDLDLDLYRRAFEMNVIGVLEISRRAAQAMRRTGGGAIIQISTLAATVMQPNMAIYSSTKRAMMVASFTMAKEFGPHDIRVNVVSPGYTTGDDLDAMWAGIAAKTGQDPAVVSAKAAKGAALRRHVDPEDIAEAVAFLASPQARNITGNEIRVDAGQVIG